MAGYFVLLERVSDLVKNMGGGRSITSSRAMRFWISKAIRESRYRTSFSRTKFFLDCDEIFDLSSRKTFWAKRKEKKVGQNTLKTGGNEGSSGTFGKIVLDLQVPFIR